MSNQKGKAPAVIGINKHNMLIQSYEAQLVELRSQIDSKTKIIIELTKHNAQILSDAEAVIKKSEELQIAFKARMNTITQLHNELDREIARSRAFQLSIEGYKYEIEVLNARKWYQLFNKRG